MYKSTITLTVLSEDPIPDDMDISTIVMEAEVGDYSMDSEITSRKISNEQMAELAVAQGSDPEFFGITETGEPVSVGC